MMPETPSKADIDIRLAGPQDLLGITRLMEKQFFSPPHKDERGKVKGRKGRIRSVALLLKKSNKVFVVASLLGRINGVVFFQRYKPNLVYSSNMAVTRTIRQVQPFILFKIISFFVERDLKQAQPPLAICGNFESIKAAPVILRNLRKLPFITENGISVELIKPKQSWLQRVRLGLYTQCFLFKAHHEV